MQQINCKQFLCDCHARLPAISAKKEKYGKENAVEFPPIFVVVARILIIGNKFAFNSAAKLRLNQRKRERETECERETEKKVAGVRIIVARCNADAEAATKVTQ